MSIMRVTMRLGVLGLALYEAGCAVEPAVTTSGTLAQRQNPQRSTFDKRPAVVHIGDPLPGLTPAQLAAFNRGDALFEEDFSKTFSNFGPIFNDVSCVACHGLGGPGGPGETREFHMGAMAGPIDEVRLANLDPSFNFLDGKKAAPGGTTLLTVGGDTMQSKALDPSLLEHAVDTRHELKGTGLRGIISMRETFTVAGLGLAVAIPDQTLIDRATYNCNPASPAYKLGIRGRPSPTQLGIPNGGFRIGRLGTKAKDVGAFEFGIGAFNNENNIPTTIIPVKEWPNQPRRPAAVEINVPQMIDVAVYQDLLAPPQPIRSVPEGFKAFSKAGCIQCHWNGYHTATTQAEFDQLEATGSGELKGLESALTNKPVPAYSDFLLHKMGGGKVVTFIDPRPEVQSTFQTDAAIGVGIDGLHGLADGAQGLGIELGNPLDPDLTRRPATGIELRTTPLWGLHLRKTYLHDGRATTLDQAIQAHFYQSDTPALPDSEANQTVRNYLGCASGPHNLNAAERAALIAFLKSL